MALAAAIGAAGHLKWAAGANVAFGGRDFTAEWYERFAPVRQTLAGMKVQSVGYVTIPGEALQALERAQSSLVPITVWADADREVVIADSVPAASLTKWKLAVVRDFGNGLVLLRRRE